jgi:formamidopyrimidine-DNA glycosylase
MPELPEVETISRALSHGGLGMEPAVGRTICRAEILWERTLATPSISEFQVSLPGQIIRMIDRRGKFLVLTLSDYFVLVHLRMSGNLRVEQAVGQSGSPLPAAKHDRALFTFLDGMRLSFNDPRKFGRIWLVDDPQKVVGELGPEPLASSFTSDELYQRLISHHRQLKPLLLDQKFIAGLGNIYTDEALHLAGLHPLMQSDQISSLQAEKLWQAIREVLLEGIQTHGASIDWVYRGGDFQNNFRVYQRTGEPCWTCGTPIERLTVGQRGTHFCPKCQPIGNNPI